MFRQMKYFQTVVRCNNFTAAAEECFISQSAISQQINSLENELGVKLINREGRKFSLTPAGEHFYRASIYITEELDRICKETKNIAGSENYLRIGYLKNYDTAPIRLAFAEFAEKYPDVKITLENGNHERLYDLLRSNQADIVLNDQRRAFNSAYMNLILKTSVCSVEIISRHPLASREYLEINDLREFPCILVASQEQMANEQSYYESYIGIKSEFIFAENIDEARMLVVAGKGFMPVESDDKLDNFSDMIKRIPLLQQGSEIRRNYCAFWDKNNKNENIESFVEILKTKF